MKLVVDTCSWLKIKFLETQKVAAFRALLYESDLWITHELQLEYQHYLVEYLDMRTFSIQKINLTPLQNYTNKTLDDADLSIIAFARMDPSVCVISDDRAELQVLSAFHIPCFQISEYALRLNQMEILSNNHTRKILKTLRQSRNIQERKYKTLLTKIG